MMQLDTAAEMIAMINPKSGAISIEGKGGIPSVVPLDMSAAMAGLKDLQYYLLRCKYGGDLDYRGRAMRELAMLMDDMRERDQGMQKPDDFVELQTMAEYIVNNSIVGSKCKRCRGSGTFRVSRTKVITCEACKGTGEKVDSPSFVARQCGYHHNTFRDRGYMRYISFWIQELSLMEQSALAHIVKQLSGKLASVKVHKSQHKLHKRKVMK